MPHTALARDTTNIKTPALDSHCHTVHAIGYFELGLGRIFSQQIENSYLSQVGYFPDLYFANHIQKTTLLALSGGYLWTRPSVWFPYTGLGFEYSHTAPHTLTGLIADYSDNQKINHSYQYQIKQQNVRLVTQIHIYDWQGWLPFIQLGMGTTWTQYNQYREFILPNLPSQHHDPKFPAKTTSSFAYHASFGINYVIKQNLWAGFSYRFDDFGKGQTGEVNNDNFLKGHLTNYSQAIAYFFTPLSI